MTTTTTGITKYKPNQWTRKYRKLPRRTRDLVNKQANELFYARSGVRRKLDPETDKKLVVVWLMCRDEVMAANAAASRSRKSSGKGSILEHPQRLPGAVFNVMSDAAMAAFDAIEYHQLMPWMKIAREEETKNVFEKEGKGTDPNVMKYLRASDDRYETKAKRDYTEKHGGEKVKWCSAFVNWCMEQCGIEGTNNARALSWNDWGTRILKPQVGAIVVLKGETWRHVAFIDYKDGKYVMLGGNQRPAGGGKSNTISYRPYSKSLVVSYRWPKGRKRPQV